MKASLRRIIHEHVLQRRGLCFLGLMCLLMEFLRSHFDILGAGWLARMTEERHLRTTLAFDILGFASSSCASILLKFLSSHVAQTIRSATRAERFSALYAMVTTIRWTRWKEAVGGEVHNLLIRKAHALSDIITISLFYCVGSAVHLLVTLCKIAVMSTPKTALLVSSGVLVAFIAFNRIQALKGMINIRQHAMFDKVIEKSVDMFVNRDLVVGNNMLAVELQRYSEVVEPFIFQLRIMWFYNCAIRSVKSLMDGVVRVLVCIFYRGSRTDSGMEVKVQLQLYDKVATNVQGFSSHTEKMSYLTGIATEDRFSTLEKDNTDEALLPDAVFDKELAARNLSGSYNSCTIYSGVNFTIQKGASVAIVGSNGSGKSTLAKQLLRLLDSGNAITLDGVPLSEYRRGSHANIASYIPQEYQLFDGTVLDNIRCFDKSVSMVWISECCIKAGVKRALDSLGYDYIVKNGGVNLSHSQKQMISLVRAFVKATPIIIVDEINIDSGVFDVLLSEELDKTVIMVTHRLENVGRFDKILFFSGGTCRDVGKFHTEAVHDPAFMAYYENNY